MRLGDKISLLRMRQGWCPGTESNRRHADFQSAALPTELPGHVLGRRCPKRAAHARSARADDALAETRGAWQEGAGVLLTSPFRHGQRHAALHQRPSSSPKRGTARSPQHRPARAVFACRDRKAPKSRPQLRVCPSSPSSMTSGENSSSPGRRYCPCNQRPRSTN